MLFGVVAISLGLDTGILARVSTVATGVSNRNWWTACPGTRERSPPAKRASADTRTQVSMTRVADPDRTLPVEGELPPLDGAVQWLNSPPLTKEALRGKVVVVDFWTYSCINCLRSLPYVQAWVRKYRDQGLVVIGVHAPEFAFECNVDNVKRVQDHTFAIEFLDPGVEAYAFTFG